MIAGRQLGAVLAGVFLGGLATTVAAEVTVRFVDAPRHVDAGGAAASELTLRGRAAPATPAWPPG